MTPDLRAFIELAAERDRRSIASTIRGVLLDWAAERVAAEQAAA